MTNKSGRVNVRSTDLTAWTDNDLGLYFHWLLAKIKQKRASGEALTETDEHMVGEHARVWDEMGRRVLIAEFEMETWR